MKSKQTTNLGVILLGRGSLYSGQPDEELAALAAAVRSSQPDAFVVEALLEQGEPSLTVALDACARHAALNVIVTPMFIPVEPATRNWLQFVARRWLQRSGSRLRITFGESLVGQPNFVSAVNHAVGQAMESGRPLPLPNPAGVNPGSNGADPDWSVIPPHSYHVLFCQGPRCTAAGAGELGAYFRKRLKEQGMEEGPEQVLAARTGCLYPCNLGPVMVAYPDGTWYCGLYEEAIDQIIQEHFIGGKAVDRYVHHPGTEPQTLSATARPYS